MTLTTAVRVVAVVSYLLLAACRTGDGANPNSPSAQVPVRGTEWTLVSINGTAIAATGRMPTLLLEEDNRASGFAGCNRFSATYSLSSDSLRLSSIAMTRMFCAQADELEQQYVSVLEATRLYRLSGAQLELATTGGLTALFEKR